MTHATARLLAAAAVVAAGILPGALAAQQTAGEATAVIAEDDVYRREVFEYRRGGRPDPFQPLTRAGGLAIRPEDLRLTGIVHSPEARLSVATFTVPGDDRRLRVRVGERIGSLTVLAIHPRRVDVRVDDFGVSRTYTIELQRQRLNADAAPPARAPQAETEQQPPPAQPPQR